MRLFQNSKIVIVLVILLCVPVPNILNAGILWEKDLVSEANTNSSPLASCINNNTNKIFVVTKVGPKGSFLHKSGDCVLWEIGINGNTVRQTLLKDADGNAIKTEALVVGPGCAMAADRSGNLLTIGVLGERRKEKSLSFISTASTPEPSVTTDKRIEEFSIKELITLQDETFASVGNRNGNGLYLRIDNQGSIIQENLFDIGNNEIFSGVAQIKSENLSLAVVGLSVKISIKDPNENSAENFIIMCDSNGRVVNDDYFNGEIPAGILFPRVCCLDDGNIIVVYNKKSEFSKTRLWARCYTQKLKLLWEREIFVTDRFLFSFDVASRGTMGFVVGMAQQECLEFYFMDQDGVKFEYVEQKGVSGGVFGVGLNLMHVDDRTIAVFIEGTGGNIKEASIKAKVIALD